MPLKSDYNHIICIMEGETKNIRFVLKIYRFVLRLLNISFCGLYKSSEFDRNSELFLWSDPLVPTFLEYFQEATASMAQESHLVVIE